MIARIVSARSSTGRGSSPAADRRVASGSRCRPIPIATQTTDLAATAAAAYDAGGVGGQLVLGDDDVDVLQRGEQEAAR